MKIQAILFDVYHTLLAIEPVRADASAAWAEACIDFFHDPPRLDWAEFNTACDSLIARLHIQANNAGIAHPEILWPRIVAEVLPEWRRLPTTTQNKFLFRHAQLARTVRLKPGAAETLRWLQQHGVTLGIVSNAQEYSMWELDQALASTHLDRSLFAPWLCFWSFENGFSKPDPHCFRLLGQRLLLRNILPEQTLMVGDRLDNDIEPAQRAGWQTWHLAAGDSTRLEREGDWQRLQQWLSESDRCLMEHLPNEANAPRVQSTL